ncbi:MAG: SDR family oxidoreductase [Deltaproteobacteria bacterium]|nr:SDR family oxidoreductase [Deltaproteobacteria bacterium]
MPVAARVVVVGAGGFLGGALVSALRSADTAVLGVGRRASATVDLVTPLERLGRALQRDDVVVCAAGLGVKDAANDVELLRGSLSVARGVASAAQGVGARLLLISSADIWPLALRGGAREVDDVEPDTAYGFSKLVAEQALCARRAQGLRYAVARPSYVFGPGMFAGRLFPAVLRQAPSGTIRLTGDRDATTDYLYVDDLTAAVRLLIERLSFDGEVVHVASGVLTRLADAARAMLDATGAKAEIVIEGAAGPRQQASVSTASLRALGFVARYDVTGGCRAWLEQLGGGR